MANRFIADQLTDESMDNRFPADQLTDESMAEFSRFIDDQLTAESMAESNRYIDDQFVSRFLQTNSRRILFEGKHRWLRPDEICEVLRNPNGVAISEKPAVMPPSGSIFLFDKKVQKHFRNDGYKWKKAKDGRTKEGHEKLKVEGCDTLHCYYAHGEEYQKFQRRSYWMLDENLSHMVLVHYRDVKGEKRKARSIKEIETAEGVQHSHETNETTPNSEMDSFASFGFNPSNFQHSQATDGTNLNSAQTSESENTDSAYNHQANFGLPRLPKWQHAMAKINAGFPDTLIRISDTPIFQMPSEAIDTESLSGLSTSDFEDAQSACDDYRWQSFCSKTVNTGFSDTTSLYSENSSCFGDDETEHSFAGDFSWEPLFGDHYTAGLSQHSFADDWSWKTLFDDHCIAGLPPWTHSRASSSVAVEPSPLGKRQRDSAASEGGKSQATHNATMEEVDKEKDEEEEGNDINQVRKRPKVTCGQKVQQFNFAIQQGEVIAGNNPAASDVAVTIDRTITDGAMNDATALSQDDETTTLGAFHIADPTVAATSAIGPIHLNPCTITNVGDQAQPPVPQPTATIGVDIAAATNKTAAPESSDPDSVQTRPTSNANQDFVQDVESQEKETEPTSFEPKNGKGKIMVQRVVGTEKFQIQDSPSILQAQEDDATTRLVAFSITDPSGAASLAKGPIHLNPDTIANVVDQAQDSQPTVTTGIVISAPIGVQASIGVLSEPMTFPKETIRGDGVSLNGAQTSEVVPPPVVLSPEEQASNEEWVSWHKAFNTLKDSMRNDARVLSSIEDLLPQGEAFTSHVDFRNTKVRSGLGDILSRFLERVGDADECLIGLSPYMRGMVFEELGILLYDMEHTPRVEVSEHRLLCWRDMINDVAALGVPVSSLIESWERSRDTMFGLHLEEDKGILDQFVKVNKLERVVELQRKELEAEKLKLKKLVHGSSKEIAACLQLAADHLIAGTSGSFEG